MKIKNLAIKTVLYSIFTFLLTQIFTWSIFKRIEINILKNTLEISELSSISEMISLEKVDKRYEGD